MRENINNCVNLLPVAAISTTTHDRIKEEEDKHNNGKNSLERNRMKLSILVSSMFTFYINSIEFTVRI